MHLGAGLVNFLTFSGTKCLEGCFEMGIYLMVLLFIYNVEYLRSDKSVILSGILDNHWFSNVLSVFDNKNL